MSTSALDLTTLLQDHYDVGHHLLSFLDTITYLRLSWTCKGIQCFLKRRWDINRRLEKFFNDPVAFRNVQASTNALIGGLFALQFLEGHHGHSTLDIYAGTAQYQTLRNYLLQAELYTDNGNSAHPRLNATVLSPKT